MSSGRIRKTGAIAGMITNGYLLMPERIERLNKAGPRSHADLDRQRDAGRGQSKKSLKVLDAKLRMLAEHADFHVNINSVVGGGIANPEDAAVISKRALALGFSSTIGIIHDGSGQLKPLGDSRTQGLGRGSLADAAQLLALQRTSRRRSPTASRTTGAAARVHGTCTSARTGWCTTARSSAAIPACLSRSTAPTM